MFMVQWFKAECLPPYARLPILLCAPARSHRSLDTFILLAQSLHRYLATSIQSLQRYLATSIQLLQSIQLLHRIFLS